MFFESDINCYVFLFLFIYLNLECLVVYRVFYLFDFNYWWIIIDNFYYLREVRDLKVIVYCFGNK